MDDFNGMSFNMRGCVYEDLGFMLDHDDGMHLTQLAHPEQLAALSGQVRCERLRRFEDRYQMEMMIDYGFPEWLSHTATYSDEVCSRLGHFGDCDGDPESGHFESYCYLCSFHIDGYMN